MQVEGFGEVEGGAGLLGGDGVIQSGVGRDDENGEAGVFGAKAGKDFKSTEVGEADVENDGVKGGGLGGLEGGVRVGGEFGDEANAADSGGKRGTDGVFIFDNEDSSG